MNEQQLAQVLEFLDPEFLIAMSEIGKYGHEKYGEQSFQHRRKQGDMSRGSMERTQAVTIANHAEDHFTMYLNGIKHDHFGTDIHQLAAVAFNAMMESGFANCSRNVQH